MVASRVAYLYDTFYDAFTSYFLHESLTIPETSICSCIYISPLQWEVCGGVPAPAVCPAEGRSIQRQPALWQGSPRHSSGCTLPSTQLGLREKHQWVYGREGWRCLVFELSLYVMIVIQFSAFIIMYMHIHINLMIPYSLSRFSLIKHVHVPQTFLYSRI